MVFYKGLTGSDNSLQLISWLRNRLTSKMELKRLELGVIERIRSSFSINTVSQCVTELVLNSLDAKSTAIAVRLNLVTFKIQVVDNGEGILEENMCLLGLRYFTNKCKSLEDLEKCANHYGFRGEAIASIVECSKTVNITSRHQNARNTYSRTLGKHSGGEVSQVKSRPSVGTTVTIEGFFQNLPVRRKRVIIELELEEIKRGIEGLIILHPNVTFSLRNDIKCDLILNSQKSEDLISSFKQLHPNLGDDFSLMKISKNKVIIDALIYKSMSENKYLQYISVNKRPIFSSKIQKLVGGLFKKNQKVDRKNPIAAIKKYPVFVMNIKCPMSKVDILLNPTKTMVEFENWDLVQRCINKLIDSFFGKGGKLKKREKFLTEELKKDCGVSQIVGACRRFGYKRKNDIDENIVETSQTIENVHKKYNDNSVLETGNDSGNILKKYTQDDNSKKCHNVEENKHESLCISDATSFDRNFRIKNKFKKPLPITVGKVKVTKNIVDNVMPEKQDDIKSSISKFTDDQNKGKNLIMDMFLKSTQIYTSDENLDILSGGSQETIYEEESNFQLENNYQTKFKGMSNTMSVSVNVKSRRKIRKRKRQPDNHSKYVQTEFVDDKFVSRAVQTRLDEKSKNKIRRYGLKELRSGRHSNNYTVVLSESGEKANFKFVMKNNYSCDDVESNIKFDSSQKCHCNCHGGKNNIFDFKEQTNNNFPNENIRIPQIGLTEDQFFKKQKHLLEPHNHMNRYKPTRHYLENWDFGIERKKRACQDYEKSPYFAPKKYSENNLVRNKQHPLYPNENFKAYSNLQYPVQLNGNFIAHEPSLPPPYYNFQSDDRFVKNERPNFSREDKLNNPNDWTVGTFGQFRPVHLSTQRDEKCDWKNSYPRHFQPSETIRDWTINSFGQFKPFLKSTQIDKENDVPEQKEMLFTPSPVEQCNPLLDSLINLLDNSLDIHDEAVKNCVSSNEDNKIEHEAEINKNVKLDNSKFNTMKDQDTLSKELEAEKSLLEKEFLNWDSQFTQDFGNDWLKKFNKCGNSYYVNKKTGFTTFQTPKLVENQFKFGKRFDFMPKGMSPILTETKQIDKSLSQHSKDMLLEYIMESYKNELLYVKWQHYLSDVDSDTFFKNIYQEKLKMFEQCIPDFSTKNNKIMDNVISFSKDLFANIEVIGQLDKKFIIVLEKKSNLLIIFDQHAVHERIRLEELLKKYDGAKSECDEKTVFFVSQNDLSLLKNHESYLEYLGISVEFFGNGVNVSTVPLCLSSKFKDNNFSNTLNKMIQLLIKQIIDHLKSTRGVHLKSLPKLLQNVVNLEACRGAIKFGDKLTKEKCKELLVQLSSCDLPFQCAHGRPTLAPLVMLELNEETVNCKPKFHKLK